MKFGGGEGGPFESPGGADTGADQGAGVSEEVIWKARAQEAEERLGVCEARVAELEAELSSARAMAAQAERRGEIERELTAAEAVDLETAALLTEAAIAGMDEPDVAVAVRELRARKPFLFGCGGPGGSGVGPGPVMGAHAEEDTGGALGVMASRARSSGDRAALLRYLRARRHG